MLHGTTVGEKIKQKPLLQYLQVQIKLQNKNNSQHSVSYQIQLKYKISYKTVPGVLTTSTSLHTQCTAFTVWLPDSLRVYRKTWGVSNTVYWNRGVQLCEISLILEPWRCDPIGSHETSVRNCHSAPRNNPEERSSRVKPCQNKVFPVKAWRSWGFQDF
jgi:hypothetical protein